MSLRVGTSGWHYDDWRPAFYPRAIAPADWLGYYARRFDTVEINYTFYRLPDEATFTKWRTDTPDDFSFTVKASRFLTHLKRLREPDEPVGRLLDHASALGAKLGATLLQLPPDLAVDRGRLDDALDAFAARQVRVACEFRHASWFCDDVYRVLETHDSALCLTDRRNRRGPLVRTASWTFLRMHEGTASPPSNYGRRAIDAWVDRLGECFGADLDGFVYFNNDHRACAVRNARTFRTRARAAGLDVHERFPEAT